MTNVLRAKNIILFLLSIALLSASCKVASKTGSVNKNGAVLIYNVNVINVKNGDILKNKAILIKKNIIEAIDDYSALQSKADYAEKIDAGGRYAIPGLWDMHMHIEEESLVEDNLALLPVYIAYGITTMRDCASDLGMQVLDWRNEINNGKLFGPRIFTAGRKLEGMHTMWKGAMEIANEKDLNEKLDSLTSFKVDFIKITENTLAGDLFLKAVIESKKRGFKVSGHVPIDLSIKDLADARFSSIEHASYLIRLGSDEDETIRELKADTLSRADANKQYFKNFDQQKAVEGYKMLARKNVAICPTLIGGKQLAYLDEDDHHNDAYLQYLSKRFKKNYSWRINRQSTDTKEQIQQRKNNYELIAKQIPYLQSSGMLILAGTDAAALNSFIYPGLALHQELVLFQKAGLAPLAALQSATINGAKFMGVDDSLGYVEPGKIADILLLNRNPLEDISATQDIFAVMKSGIYYNRKALDSLLETAKQKSIELDAKRGD